MKSFFTWLPALLAITAVSALAQTPEQFRVWGSVGKAFPDPPIGWSETPVPDPLLQLITPTPEELKRGFLIRAVDHCFASPSGPILGRIRELRAFCTPGEYEPLVFAIHPLRPLHDIRISVGELRSSTGSIPPDQMDLRIARRVRAIANGSARQYQREPFLLEKPASLELAPPQSTILWITLRAPENLAAGDYRGQVALESTGGSRSILPVVFTLLPFALPAVPVETVAYFQHPSGDDRMLDRELVDLREHGMNSPVPQLAVQIKSRDRQFGPDDVAETTRHCRRMLEHIRKAYGSWTVPLTFEVGHQIAYYWDPSRGWFVHWPHSPQIEADLALATETLLQTAREYGVPRLRAFLIDEPGAHNLLDEGVYLHGWLKRRFPGLPGVVSIGGGIALGFDEIGQLSPVVDFLQLNRFTPDIAGKLRALQRPFGIYNGAGFSPAGARLFFGFYGWKTGAEQIGQWAYSFGEGIFAPGGLRKDDEGYVYHAADGVLPSIMWEAVREGIDDYRYVELLYRLIAVARQSEQPALRRAASDAAQVLDHIWEQIGWTVQPIQTSERALPPVGSTLRKWRWQITRQILALHTQVQSAPTKRPSALDLPWRHLPPEAGDYAPEMLPNSGFESGLKPWRIEAWSGKGAGELDPAEKHGGAHSVRITVPAAAGVKAVTVLVWPQYGDGKLNLPLQRDRTYEFSAWVKLKDRTLPPELRISLPPGASAGTRTGQDPADPAGWQRLWLRTTVKSNAVPVYLAAWIQGPGTVWLDDLSLREFIPPSLRLNIDQPDYDAQDAYGTATVQFSKQLEPASLRFTIADEHSKPVAVITAPLQNPSLRSSPDGSLNLLPSANPHQRAVSFPAAELKPGSYRATAVLLDSNGRELALQTLAFKRLVDP